MLELLDVKKGMEILEIGAGTGYLVALLSHLTEKEGKVFGIEYIPQLAKKAVERLLKQKIKNFEIIVGNGRDGLEKNAPFDRIILSAACDKVPKKLFSQLKENGKLVAPIGTETHQELICFQKKNGKIVEIEKKSWFVFVPLVE
jgi:protein-L-isoaspartate(D-aspartate) O-methyltransferase